MFNFFKKKEKTAPKTEKEETTLNDDQKKQLNEEIERRNDEVNELSKSSSVNKDALATCYEKIGLAFFELGNMDEALANLEKSLDYKLTIGDGYKKLMSIYNKKRAEAAKNADDEGIEKYMNKMDEMRQIAKKVTITG